MNARYPVLSIVATICKIVGWIVVAVGVIVFLIGLFKDAWFAEKMGLILGGLGGILIGLFQVAYGEMIGVAVAIEDNTRQTVNGMNARLDMVIKLLSKGGGVPVPAQGGAPAAMLVSTPAPAQNVGFCGDCGAGLSAQAKASGRCPACGAATA